ncbi:unnamed protein product [Caenorhabditis angaria]|uniref:ShKT domain-containing protein n=1 Tax=Caenorhabditis angaria TaxID=860376 RepID=A0A9P1INC5_9PELO|nr:unnamed protein product [Caenorhabditis angaria]
MNSNLYFSIFFIICLVDEISSREYSIEDLFSITVEDTTKSYQENNDYQTIEKSKITREEPDIAKYHVTEKQEETTESTLKSYSFNLHRKVSYQKEEETSKKPQSTSEGSYEIVIYEDQITSENEATTKNSKISYPLNLHQKSSERTTESDTFYISEESDEWNSNEITYDNLRRESKKHQLVPETCEDFSDSCEKLNICENEEISLEFKKLYCADTCGFCSFNRNCKDLFGSCGRWRSKGLCRKSEIRKTACAKTCGSC